MVDNTDKNGELKIELTPYTDSGGSDCGQILYKAKSEHSKVAAGEFDVF